MKQRLCRMSVTVLNDDEYTGKFTIEGDRPENEAHDFLRECAEIIAENPKNKFSKFECTPFAVMDDSGLWGYEYVEVREVVE